MLCGPGAAKPSCTVATRRPRKSNTLTLRLVGMVPPISNLMVVLGLKGLGLARGSEARKALLTWSPGTAEASDPRKSNERLMSSSRSAWVAIPSKPKDKKTVLKIPLSRWTAAPPLLLLNSMHRTPSP